MNYRRTEPTTLKGFGSPSDAPLTHASDAGSDAQQTRKGREEKIMPRRPWTTTDRFAARAKLAVVVAFATTAAAVCGIAWSDASSDSSHSSHSSRSSSSDERYSEDDEEAAFAWQNVLSAAQAGLVASAVEPFRRPGVRYAIGPREVFL